MTSQTSYIDVWYDIMENKADPRVKDWFMMSSIFPTIFVILTYIYFVKVLGPKYMEKRKPYNLNNIMLAYNLIQVIISVYLFFEMMRMAWWRKYSYICQPIDFSNNPDSVAYVWICYLYYISKFTELLDTVFFVLRKKNKQISILHVAHHSIMPTFCWIGIKFVPGGNGTFFALLNTFVHIWMYLYYLLAALGPMVQPYLWWKQYLTIMQIVQFVVVFCHSAQLFFIECDYPKFFNSIIMIHTLFFILMFSNFYYQAYRPKGEKTSEFNVAELEVDPHREGIKQSELRVKNYEHIINKRRANDSKRD